MEAIYSPNLSASFARYFFPPALYGAEGLGMRLLAVQGGGARVVVQGWRCKGGGAGLLENNSFVVRSLGFYRN